MVVKALDYFFAARPMLHIPIWSVGYMYAYDGPIPKVMGGARAWCLVDSRVLLAMSLVAAGAYYLNLIYDQETDAINKKLGFLQRGMVTTRGLWLGFGILSVMGLGLAGYLSLELMAIVSVQFVIGCAYSASPIKLKDRPYLGVLANALVFGALVPVAANTSCPEIVRESAAVFENAMLSGLELQWGISSSVYFFFAVASSHVLTTIPDSEGDRAVGKRTIAVELGKNRSLWIAAALAVVSVVWSATLWTAPSFAILSVVAVGAVLLTVFAIVTKSPASILAAAKVPLFVLTILTFPSHLNYFLFLVALVFATRIYYRRRFGITYPKLA